MNFNFHPKTELYRPRRNLTFRFAIASAGFLLSLFICLPSCRADEQVYQIKAAFLLNFAKYVDWPEEAALSKVNKFKFCIVSNQEQLQKYKVLEGKTLNDRPISVELLRTLEDVSSCRVVFLPEGEQPAIGTDTLNLIRNKPILTVSETIQSSMIYLFEDDGRIKFDVNLINAEAAGLKLRSEILKLAHQVKN